MPAVTAKPSPSSPSETPCFSPPLGGTWNKALGWGWVPGRSSGPSWGLWPVIAVCPVTGQWCRHTHTGRGGAGPAPAPARPRLNQLRGAGRPLPERLHSPGPGARWRPHALRASAGSAALVRECCLGRCLPSLNQPSPKAPGGATSPETLAWSLDGPWWRLHVRCRQAPTRTECIIIQLVLSRPL